MAESEAVAELLSGLQDQLRQARYDLGKLQESFHQSYSCLVGRVEGLQAQVEDLLAKQPPGPDAGGGIETGVSPSPAQSPLPTPVIANAGEQTELPQMEIKPTVHMPLDPELIGRDFAGAHEVVAEMRQRLQYLLRHPNEWDVLRGLQTTALGLSGRSSIKNPISLIAATLGDLVSDLLLMPEQTSKSSLRTISQGLECLSLLLEPASLSRVGFLDLPVLVCVDDEHRAHEQVMSAMARIGVQVLPFLRPGEALERLAATKCDIVMLDMSMPEMSGLHLCRQIRVLEFHKRTPIVFVTGSANAESRAQSSLNGGNDFIAKPFHLTELALKALLWIYRKQLGLT